VIVGDSFKSKPNRLLKDPPYKDVAKKIKFDSVCSEDETMFVVYSNDNAYPEYIVDFV